MFLFQSVPLLHAVHGVANTKQRFQSSYVGSLARRVREREETSNASFHRSDPEAVIRSFESQPSLHSNPAAVSEYVKALVKADRLDESELLRTLQRGSNNQMSHITLYYLRMDYSKY